MSWSSRPARRVLLGAALVATLTLGGCSGFRAVYGDQGIAQSRMELSYAEPDSRLDQVVYQEFVLRFGRSDGEQAPRLEVTTATYARGLTMTGVSKPATQFATTVTVRAILTAPDGRVVFTGSRTATAQYATVGQVLADTEARDEAEERAAKEAAEALRLAILGALATPASGA